MKSSGLSKTMTSAQNQNQSDLESFLQCLEQWPTYSGYKELDKTRKEIRVLKIWFPPGSQDLHGSLEYVSLESSPQFEALSYYWGPPDEQRSIIIDGQVVMITKNLHVFLAILCSFGQELPVWVDSLCIHQTDMQERNHQVTMMGDIYRKATRVQAWIGDPDADSNFALDYAGFLQTGALSTDIGYPQKFKDRIYQAFRVILARPYWDRMWIIQELVLASDLLVVSGSRRVSWDDFVTAMNHVSDIQTRSAASSHTRLLADRINDLNIIRSSNRSQSLFQLVTKFADQLCTDPRDKIYALLGIANQDSGPHIPVDYSRAPLEIYFDVLFSAVSTILSSHDTVFSLTNALSDFAQVAMRILGNLSISSSDFMSEFFQSSVRVPVPNSRLSLNDNHRSHRTSVFGLFNPKNENLSLQTGDLAFRLSPFHSIVVRADSLQRRYEIVGIFDKYHFYQKNEWCREYLAAVNVGRRCYGKELCDVLERTKDGRIDTIYVHVNRAGFLIQMMIMGFDRLSGHQREALRRLVDQTILPIVAYTSRLCTCTTSNLDTFAGTPNDEPILCWLNAQDHELQIRALDDVQPLSPMSMLGVVPKVVSKSYCDYISSVHKEFLKKGKFTEFMSCDTRVEDHHRNSEEYGCQDPFPQ